VIRECLKTHAQVKKKSFENLTARQTFWLPEKGGLPLLAE
jgi:hypothetical protein